MYICLKGHHSGSLEKSLQPSYLNKRGSVYDKQEKETLKKGIAAQNNLKLRVVCPSL
jgi:hypothetical protein